MAGGYSRVVEFSVTNGVPTCVELPAVPRGSLRRLAIKDLQSNSSSGTFTVYNRRGACDSSLDLNVDESGLVNTITDNGSGSATISFTAATDLKVGDQIDVKGNNRSAYNTRHTVVSVIDTSTVVTDISYTADGSDGVWQTKPFIELSNPAMHAVYAGSISSGAFAAYDLYIGFENSDNQSETLRMRHQALWLEITMGSSTTLQAAITTESDTVL